MHREDYARVFHDKVAAALFVFGAVFDSTISGEVVRSLGDGLSMTMNLCLCIQPEDSDVRYNVSSKPYNHSDVSKRGTFFALVRGG